jgi:hypothetical protein
MADTLGHPAAWMRYEEVGTAFLGSRGYNLRFLNRGCDRDVDRSLVD